jgi:hypothetical protein
MFDEFFDASTQFCVLWDIEFILTCTFLFWGKHSVFLKAVFIFRKLVLEKLLFKFFCVYLLLKKLVNGKYFLVNEKYFPVKEKFGLIFRKVFSFYLGEKHFLEVVKILKISYYLLIISNLILKLLIIIYIFCFEYFFFNFIS